MLLGLATRLDQHQRAVLQDEKRSDTATLSKRLVSLRRKVRDKGYQPRSENRTAEQVGLIPAQVNRRRKQQPKFATCYGNLIQYRRIDELKFLTNQAAAELL
jgi:hypothetical protein